MVEPLLKNCPHRSEGMCLMCATKYLLPSELEVIKDRNTLTYHEFLKKYDRSTGVSNVHIESETISSSCDSPEKTTTRIVMSNGLVFNFDTPINKETKGISYEDICQAFASFSPSMFFIGDNIDGNKERQKFIKQPKTSDTAIMPLCMIDEKILRRILMMWMEGFSIDLISSWVGLDETNVNSIIDSYAEAL